MPIILRQFEYDSSDLGESRQQNTRCLYEKTRILVKKELNIQSNSCTFHQNRIYLFRKLY